MARKKKNDFWDDVEDLNTVSDNDQTGDDDTAEVAVDEEWSAVKSLPLKVIHAFSADGIVSGGTCVSLYRL